MLLALLYDHEREHRDAAHLGAAYQLGVVPFCILAAFYSRLAMA